MEKAVHSRPVSEEDEALSCSKKPRLEASPSSEDIEKYTIFTDSEYKLPLYLSKFALSLFNSEKEASYEKVNVVKTMKSLDVVEGTTYLVTFEASLPNKSNNVKTFQTKIFVSPLIPLNLVIVMKMKFVRMKPSGFDYNVEEDSEEKVCESEEEGSKEEVSAESEEEDSEEELSDESDEEDNVEKLCESDEEDKNEGIQTRGGRKNVGGKAPRIQLALGGGTYYEPPNINISTPALNKLVSLSQLAICVYNMNEVTYYDNVKVLKAMAYAFRGIAYSITFEASLSDGNAMNFQTEISVEYHKIKIYYVRIEPSINSDDITE